MKLFELLEQLEEIKRKHGEYVEVDCQEVNVNNKKITQEDLLSPVFKSGNNYGHSPYKKVVSFC
jgi:hypothetical protein